MEKYQGYTSNNQYYDYANHTQVLSFYGCVPVK